MKKIVLIAISLIALGGGISEAVTQYNSIGNVQMSSSTMTGALTMYMLTRTQVAALTAQTTGQLVLCQNCVTGNAGTYNICISTGVTATGQFIMVSTAAALLGCQ